MKLQLDPADLQPLVETVVSEVLARTQADDARIGNRLAFTEPEAAALIGTAPHVVRDCRLRGELTGVKIGKRIHYEADELRKFLRRNRQGN